MDDRIALLYRAQDEKKTSSVGLAWSDDGITFQRRPEPVLAPTEPYEQPGGCEDPRVVRIDGTYYLTYTGYDGTSALLCLATSTDLVHWENTGPCSPTCPTPSTARSPGTSPAPSSPHPSTAPTGCTSGNQTSTGPPPKTSSTGKPVAPATPSPGRCSLGRVPDRAGATAAAHRRRAHPAGVQRPLGRRRRPDQGPVLKRATPHRPGRPHKAVARLEQPFLIPTSDDEQDGQVNHVVFSEGLVHYHDTWFLYYGMADSVLGTATYRPHNPAH
ncbi:hypothetical protein NKH77_00500 [Streptomyces sp. M19]